MRDSDIITAAIGVIETRGWCRGFFYDVDQADEGVPAVECRVCTLGAINVARGRPVDAPIVFDDPVVRLLGAHFGRSAAGWNDKQLSGFDVIAGLRAVAAVAREEGR